MANLFSIIIELSYIFQNRAGNSMNDLDEHDNSRAERSMQEPNREV